MACSLGEQFYGSVAMCTITQSDRTTKNPSTCRMVLSAKNDQTIESMIKVFALIMLSLTQDRSVRSQYKMAAARAELAEALRTNSLETYRNSSA